MEEYYFKGVLIVSIQGVLIEGCYFKGVLINGRYFGVPR